MIKLNLHIKQNQKFFDRFSLLNLQNEIYEMYDELITWPSKKDLSFYVLLFFSWIKDEKGNLFLDKYLSFYLEKLEKFINELSSIKRKLKKDEYTELKKRNWLDSFLKNDTFFILLYSLHYIEEYNIKYSDLLDENTDIRDNLNYINQKFWKKILNLYYNFSEIYIEDDRIDEETWEIIDLSKSVSRPIEMRLSKKVENTLKSQTEIKEIKSNSPIDLIFTQFIDHNLIYLLWDKFKIFYHLNSSLKDIWIQAWSFANQNLPSWLILLCLWYLHWKSNNKENNTKQQKVKKEDLDKFSFPILLVILNQLLISNEIKNQKVEKLEKELEEIKISWSSSKEIKKKKTKIELRIRNLKNISISVTNETEITKNN